MSGQLASEPRSELFYDTAVSRMHTLLSIVAIIKSTEPDFSLISDDTAGDAPCHFDVTVYLLTRLGQENLFSCKDEAQSSTLHDTFLRLLVMLDQCICNPRYVERLTPSEENLM